MIFQVAPKTFTGVSALFGFGLPLTIFLRYGRTRTGSLSSPGTRQVRSAATSSTCLPIIVPFADAVAASLLTLARIDKPTHRVQPRDFCHHSSL